jgi:hypothetical protein
MEAFSEGLTSWGANYPSEFALNAEVRRVQVANDYDDACEASGNVFAVESVTHWPLKTLPRQCNWLYFYSINVGLLPFVKS